MRDKRRVEDLSIEELEQVLAMRRREERQQRLDRMNRTGRIIQPEQAAPTAEPDPAPAPEAEAAGLTIHRNGRVKPLRNGRAAPPNEEPMVLLDDDTGTASYPAQRGRVGAAHPEAEGTRKKQVSTARRTTNIVLMLVEVAAVIGLVYLCFELLTGIRTLESSTAEAQQEMEAARARTVPTLAPTPVLALNQIVLPGGHQYIEGQTPTLNIEEIPENVRFVVADQIMRPVINRPPQTDETALRVIIPKLNIDQAIVQGSDWEALKQGVGQVLNGYDPGDDTGRLALTAHNDIYGELFKDIDQLEPGDQFQVQTREQVYLYQVNGSDVVRPTDVHVLNGTGAPTAVLVSCYPYRVNTQRIVVFADRIG